MKYCPSCNIKIEGSFEQCPLCQNELEGEKSPDVYPAPEKLKKQTLLYKLQLFIFIIIMLISLTAEYMLDVKLEFHWSILISVWVIGCELWLVRFIRNFGNPSKLITSCGLWSAILILATFHILDIRPIYFCWVMPSIAIAALVLHFVVMMFDKTHNAMAHLLGCSFLCIAIGILCMAVTGEKNILWVICILLGVIAVIGAVIFKGRTVSSELEKRFHI